MGQADDHRAENDRRQHHAQKRDESVPQRLHLNRRGGRDYSKQNREEYPDQNLDVELSEIRHSPPEERPCFIPRAREKPERSMRPMTLSWSETLLKRPLQSG